MRIIAVSNARGGCGKTTTAVNLAACLAERDRAVLVVDLDPSASASNWLGVPDSGSLLYEVLEGKQPLASAIKVTETVLVDLVPASIDLADAETDLVEQLRSGTVLKNRLKTLSRSQYEYVILDCPPHQGLLTANALGAAGEIIIPVNAHVMSLEGLVLALEAVELAKKRYNPRLQLTGILPVRFDTRTRHAHEVVEDLRSRFKRLIFKTVIRENVRLAECPSFKKPIIEYARSSYGAEDYRALAQEVERRQPK